RIALINLARFFNIPNWEYDDNKTLYDKIISLKGSDAILIVELLKKYFTAYNEWFDFYVKIKDIETQTGQAYSLTNKEKDELSELIKNREGSLNILQTKFDELQLGKFNVSHGLGNIDGKIII
ncbi:MAG TPA: hypothetical protein VNG53_04335, partial [Bacteroidia bacterium]|nr:hypothetical protein [Bacteroidia bacterium]